jgi:FKBP-type peptidyl-prolyl cis-trans isomerase
MQELTRTQGVVCTASGLCYEGLSQGVAAPPDDNDLVVISYKQTLINGSPVESFDSTLPARFPAGKVIVGFVEALKLMRAPAKARFYVPAKLAFNDRGAGTRVPPWSALIIDAELVRVDRVE